MGLGEGCAFGAGHFNFLYATGVLMLLSVVVMMIASCMTIPPPEERTRGLTYGSIHHLAADEIHYSWNLGNKLMAVRIITYVIAMYAYFSFWLK